MDPNAEPKQGLAVTALVLAIVGFLTGLFLFGLLLDVAAIIVGAIAASKAKREPEAYGGRGMAIAAIIVGVVGLLLTILIIALMVTFAGGLEGFVEQYCDDNPDDPNCEEFQSAALGVDGGILAALPFLTRPQPIMPLAAT